MLLAPVIPAPQYQPHWVLRLPVIFPVIDYNVVAVIGDGGITGGMAIEGLNQTGHIGTRLIVVLNDNGMSISPTVGAIARLLDRIRFDHRYLVSKEKSQKLLKRLPLG